MSALIADGTAQIAVGGLIAGGFGVELAKSIMTDQPAGRLWFALSFAAGLALVVLGLHLKTRVRRQAQVGIVATVLDPHLGVARTQWLNQQAEVFGRRTCKVTLKTDVTLPEDGVLRRDLVSALAEETLLATMMAERLAPDAVRINLIPTMPLHIAFWFGAKLGCDHARDVVVYDVRQSNGAPAFFPATSLRAVDADSEPLIIDRLEALDEGDTTKVALAIDMQAHGDQFFDPVVAACRERGIGYLLRIRSGPSPLAEDSRTFSGAVEQVCRAWREAPLQASARVGQHMIFLNGPVAVAVALGARMASPEHGRWTAFTFDATNNAYEPFPAPTSD